MQEYLFLFTIGPVQSFIAQARKTQDLYAGSQILSDLIRWGMHAFENLSQIGGEKPTFIFPKEYTDSNHENQGFSRSNPNRFLAITEVQDVEELGKTVEAAVRERFRTTATTTFEQTFSGLTKPQGFCEQIEQFLEVYWVAVPYTKENYKENYRQIEKYLGAVKHVRAFKQLEEKGRKCSLCGVRNGLFYSELRKKNKPAYLHPSAIYVQKNINKNETLCAVDFVKRFYEAGYFPSTAKIALWDLWKNDEILQMIRTLEGLFKKNNFDQQFLFEENLTENYFEVNKVKLREGNTLKDVQSKREAIFQKAKELQIKTSKYYALLTFDGDDMGKWLSGEKSGGELEEFHKKLSKCLINFAEKSRKIVDSYGATVYAGGDDFLGFVNLNHLFKVLKGLQCCFNTLVNEKLVEYIGNEQLTFSVGVVIAHYKMPLGKVLLYGREMLEKAKQYKENEKNRYGILCMKGNTAIGEMYVEPTDVRLLEDLTAKFQAKDQQKISPSFVYKYGLEIQSLPMSFVHWEESESMMNICKAELKRLVKRASTDKNTSEEVIEKLVNHLGNQFYEKKPIQYINRSYFEEEYSGNYHIDMQNFISFIKIAKQLTSI